jgi:hypothetical protein
MAHPVAQIGVNGKNWLTSLEHAFCNIVDRYAVAKAIAENRYEDDYVANDFFYYCFTKSTKTLVALNLLISQHLGEDAQILVRSAYENYLAMSFLAANPSRLEDVVDKKVGLHTGHFRHLVTPKRRVDYRKIIDTESGEILPFDLSVAEMASLGRYSEDREVHWPLYGFLSEHCDPHMMASGNYRDRTDHRYSYENKHQVLQAVVYATYVYTLLLAEVCQFESLQKTDSRDSAKLLKKGVAIIKRALAILVFEPPLESLPEAMKNRLAHCVVGAPDV